ncbi:hypothetical protein HRR80_004739 [Exophiala dermatitidis]|uniref:Uncharacterized protein n=1 Tax=Exophiala dermatitidis TaxID=5970 RepID=A0AAN6ETM9_EXODE|nr:hypothetical protein HRR80_004739 [Exophiala dermatitidis]
MDKLRLWVVLFVVVFLRLEVPWLEKHGTYGMLSGAARPSCSSAREALRQKMQLTQFACGYEAFHNQDAKRNSKRMGWSDYGVVGVMKAGSWVRWKRLSLGFKLDGLSTHLHALCLLKWK